MRLECHLIVTPLSLVSDCAQGQCRSGECRVEISGCAVARQEGLKPLPYVARRVAPARLALPTGVLDQPFVNLQPTPSWPRLQCCATFLEGRPERLCVTTYAVRDSNKLAITSLCQLLEHANVFILIRTDKTCVAALPLPVRSNCAESTLMFSQIASDHRIVEGAICRQGRKPIRSRTIQKSVCHCTMIWPIIFGCTEQ